MKLCRFELIADPGSPRSGIVHSGKVYETDGANPIAVHEAPDVHLLPPVGRPKSLRFFRIPERLTEADDEALPLYSYGNASSLAGGNQIVLVPELAAELDYEPYLAVILASDGLHVPVEQADGIILGISILNVIVMRDVERQERRSGAGPGRSHDLALILGPVMTTPEELDDSVVDETRGRRYRFSAVSRVNGVERRRGDALEMAYTPAELISAASETAPVLAGDLIAIGPLLRQEEPFRPLEPGDEIQISVDKLGTLTTRIELPK